jgi:putative modified peptide
MFEPTSVVAQDAAELASQLAPCTMSRAVVDRLLQLLSTDDAFRDRFVADPRVALRALGHETPSEVHGIPRLDPVTQFSHFRGGLASKETIAAGRRTLAELLMRPNGVPFTHCAE